MSPNPPIPQKLTTPTQKIYNFQISNGTVAFIFRRAENELSVEPKPPHRYHQRTISVPYAICTCTAPASKWSICCRSNRNCDIGIINFVQIHYLLDVWKAGTQSKICLLMNRSDRAEGPWRMYCKQWLTIRLVG